MIKINLVREGRAPVRGAAGPGAAVTTAGGGAANPNNLVILACLILAALVAGGMWFVKKRELAGKQAEVEVQRVEAQKLEKIIAEVEAFEQRKDNLQKRIDTINDLKRTQKAPVKIMDHISTSLPDLVWLDQMDLQGGVISIRGRGLNPNAIAAFITNVKNDEIFEEPEVSTLNQTSGGASATEVWSFQMNVRLKPEKAIEPADGADPVPASAGS